MSGADSFIRLTRVIALMCLGIVWVAANAAPFSVHKIQSPVPGLGMALHHLPPRTQTAAEPCVVLFIHGATFPSRLAAGYPFGGESWMEHLAGRGCDVWALDFLGYGASDRYPQMDGEAYAAAPLGRAPLAADQIANAVAFIRGKTHAPSIALIAHSWGTIPAALFTTRHPEHVTRLVLFGPVVPRGESDSAAQVSAYSDVTSQQQQERFDGYVPPGEPLLIDRTELKQWCAAYLASDASSTARNPPSVRVPAGPQADAQAAWSGHQAYDPALIRVPTLIVYGEWDEVTRDVDASRLAQAISRADVEVKKIPRATHVMHLETQRGLLSAAVDEFLSVPFR